MKQDRVRNGKRHRRGQCTARPLAITKAGITIGGRNPIYACVSQVVAFPQVSPPKSCMKLSFPPYVLHARLSHSSRFDYTNNIW
jgi:hypothetical protein